MNQFEANQRVDLVELLGAALAGPGAGAVLLTLPGITAGAGVIVLGPCLVVLAGATAIAYATATPRRPTR